jgi:mono/diheme cytochrome c family protein
MTISARLTLATALSLYVFAGRGSASAEGQSAGARPDALADGKRLYDANCANCHGARAQGAVKAGFEISIIAERGGKQPPDLTDPVWDHGSSDTDVFTVIKKGIPSGMMAPYEGRLSDVEIQNVVAYVRSLSSQPAATTAAPSPAPVAPTPANPERTLELADFVELPITGDGSTDRVSGVLARGSILRDEPGSRQRFFVNDLTGPLYMLDKQTKQLTTYLNFKDLFPNFTAAQGYAAGLMNFVFDPDYTRNGVFYTLHMETFSAPGGSVPLQISDTVTRGTVKPTYAVAAYPHAPGEATRSPTASYIEGNASQPCRGPWCSAISRRGGCGTPK